MLQIPNNKVRHPRRAVVNNAGLSFGAAGAIKEDRGEGGDIYFG